MWIYGRHAVAAALNNPDRRRRRLLATEDAAAVLGAGGGAAEIVARDDIAAVLPAGAVHQDAALLVEPLAVVAVAELCARIAAAERSAVVVLDRVSDPHNVGAVLRSAAVFGALGVIVPERGAPEVTGALAKAASGALESVPLLHVPNLVRAMTALKDAGMWCVGLDAAAPTTLAELELAPRTALVLGAESAGLRRLTRETCDLLARIPAPGALTSLNVSNACAVALYEYARSG